MDFRCKRHCFCAAIFFSCCFCFSIHEIFTAYCNGLISPSETSKFLFSIESDHCYQNLEGNQVWEMARGMRGRIVGARRLLGGLGSSPPRCTFKCGRCNPCKPVHVPVPPGTRLSTEYYPEAWRCKCGNKLYMP